MISLLDCLGLLRTPLSFIKGIILVGLIGHLACTINLGIRSLSVLLDLTLRLLQCICVQLVLCLAK